MSQGIFKFTQPLGSHVRMTKQKTTELEAEVSSVRSAIDILGSEPFPSLSNDNVPERYPVPTGKMDSALPQIE